MLNQMFVNVWAYGKEIIAMKVNSNVHDVIVQWLLFLQRFVILRV